MQRISLAIIVALGCILFVYSCKHESGPEPAQPGGTGSTGGGNTGGGNTGGGGFNPADTALCFERDILPIFISNCAKSGCHDQASHEEGYILDNYNGIMKGIEKNKPWDSEIYEAITAPDSDKDRMPQKPNPRLTTEQVALIRRWILEGAKNTTNCPTLCDSSKFTFAAAIQPMLNNYCKGCHSTAAPSKGVILDTYNGVLAVAQDGRLVKAIRHLPGATPMPQGGNKLSDCQIRQVEKWIAAGAQNN
jgi:mono/diheme cytochrome c family protein